MTVDIEELLNLNTSWQQLIHKKMLLEKELQNLTEEIYRVESGFDLPTEPGWYLTADDTPARLNEDGVWDDGFGNTAPSIDQPWSPLPLRKMTVDTTPQPE